MSQPALHRVPGRHQRRGEAELGTGGESDAAEERSDLARGDSRPQMVIARAPQASEPVIVVRSDSALSRHRPGRQLFSY